MRLQLLYIALAASAVTAQSDATAASSVGDSLSCMSRVLSLLQATPTVPPALSDDLATDSPCVPTSLAQPASDLMSQISAWSSSMVKEASACPPFASSSNLVPALPTLSVCGVDGTSAAAITSGPTAASSSSGRASQATNTAASNNSTRGSQSPNAASRETGALFAVAAAAAAAGLAAMAL